MTRLKPMAALIAPRPRLNVKIERELAPISQKQQIGRMRKSHLPWSRVRHFWQTNRIWLICWSRNMGDGTIHCNWNLMGENVTLTLVFEWSVVWRAKIWANYSTINGHGGRGQLGGALNLLNGNENVSTISHLTADKPIIQILVWSYDLKTAMAFDSQEIDSILVVTRELAWWDDVHGDLCHMNL